MGSTQNYDIYVSSCFIYVSIWVTQLKASAAVSCNPDAYRLGGSDWEFGDGQAGSCMGRCMGGAWVVVC